MDYLVYYICAMAAAVFALPASLVMAFGTNRRLLSITIWLLAPVLAICAAAVCDCLVISGSAFAQTETLLDVSFVGSILLLPWLALSTLGAMSGSMIKTLWD